MANIFETARAEREYNKYVKGVESIAGLVETLSGPGPFTIFVPTDAAFDRLSADKQANLFADPEKLSKVLRYHIVPGYYTANDLLDRLFLKTLEGQRLRVWSDLSEVPLGEREIDSYRDALNYVSSDTVTTTVRESIKINGGHVIRANVNADNGATVGRFYAIASIGKVQFSGWLAWFMWLVLHLRGHLASSRGGGSTTTG